MAFLWVVAVALLVRSELSIGRHELLWLGAWAAVAAWVAASLLWSADVTQTVHDTERALVYVAAVAAFLVLTRRGATVPALAGAATAIALVSTYALATRLFPERLGVYDPMAG